MLNRDTVVVSDTSLLNDILLRANERFIRLCSGDVKIMMSRDLMHPPSNNIYIHIRYFHERRRALGERRRALGERMRFLSLSDAMQLKRPLRADTRGSLRHYRDRKSLTALNVIAAYPCIHSLCTYSRGLVNLPKNNSVHPRYTLARVHTVLKHSTLNRGLQFIICTTYVQMQSNGSEKIPCEIRHLSNGKEH